GKDIDITLAQHVWTHHIRERPPLCITCMGVMDLLCDEEEEDDKDAIIPATQLWPSSSVGREVQPSPALSEASSDQAGY
ncbi:hypothetical protein ABVT39_009847, partial [Epinephelus coioides]